MPDPSFGMTDGGKRKCWNCGSTEHERKDCPDYKKGRAANGNKHVPGAWEKLNPRPAAKSKIAPLIQPELTEDEDEEIAPAPARVNMWALPVKPKTKFCGSYFSPLCSDNDCDGECQPTPAPEIPMTKGSNSLANLVEELVDEEEREMIATLQGWAKVKQGRGAARRKTKKAHQDWLMAVSEKRKLIEEELEDLDEDEELVLMDSGCGNHACHPTKHFKKFRMRSSAGSRAGQVFYHCYRRRCAEPG